MDISNRPKSFVRVLSTGQVGLVTDYERADQYLIQCGGTRSPAEWVWASPADIEELTEEEIKERGLEGVGR